MDSELRDLFAFLAVLRAGGFREGARASGLSASRLSESVRRLETRLGVRLLHRTTRSVAPTEAGARLAERLVPALGEVEAALDVVNHYRDRPAGTLKLNVPATVARLVLPPIVAPFLRAYPDIRLEVVVEDSFVDLLAAGCDAACATTSGWRRTWWPSRSARACSAWPLRLRRLTWPNTAGRGIPETCSNTPACADSSPAATSRLGSSNAMARSCVLTQTARCLRDWAAAST